MAQLSVEGKDAIGAFFVVLRDDDGAVVMCSPLHHTSREVAEVEREAVNRLMQNWRGHE